MNLKTVLKNWRELRNIKDRVYEIAVAERFSVESTELHKTGFEGESWPRVIIRLAITPSLVENGFPVIPYHNSLESVSGDIPFAEATLCKVKTIQIFAYAEATPESDAQLQKFALENNFSFKVTPGGMQDRSFTDSDIRYLDLEIVFTDTISLDVDAFCSLLKKLHAGITLKVTS